MSTIFVKIAGINGESTHPDFMDQVECFSLRHTVSLPVVTAATRVEGTSSHGPIILSHTIDKASPLLKRSVLTGANVGDVEITRMRTAGGRMQPVEVIRLTNTFVVRVDVETPIDEATRELSDELLESFHLEYGDIRWMSKKFVNDIELGSISGGWSVSTQNTI